MIEMDSERHIFPIDMFSPPDMRDYKFKSKLKDFPDEFELDELPVKNQGSTGSCVPHAVSELVEYINRWQEGSYVRMSTGYIYGNREFETRKLTGGYYTRLAMKVLKERGDCPWELFSNNEPMPKAEELYLNRDKSIDSEAYKNRISTYFKVEKPNEVKTLLYDELPVVCSLKWDGSVKADKNNIVSFPNGDKATGGHCVLIVGWNKDGWIIQNSWGEKWGRKGRATIPYDAPIKEMWGVSDDIVNGLPYIKVKKPNWLTKLIHKIYTFIHKKYCG